MARAQSRGELEEVVARDRNYRLTSGPARRTARINRPWHLSPKSAAVSLPFVRDPRDFTES
jgi:hypothetical protein